MRKGVKSPGSFGMRNDGMVGWTDGWMTGWVDVVRSPPSQATARQPSIGRRLDGWMTERSKVEAASHRFYKIDRTAGRMTRSRFLGILFGRGSDSRLGRAGRNRGPAIADSILDGNHFNNRKKQRNPTIYAGSLHDAASFSNASD